MWRKYLFKVRFEVSTAVTMMIIIFWEMIIITCSRCSANVVAFSLSFFAQLLSNFRTGGIDI
jgi:hypothetical protein